MGLPFGRAAMAPEGVRQMGDVLGKATCPSADGEASPRAGVRLRPRAPHGGKVIPSAGLLAHGSSLGPPSRGWLARPQWHLWPSLAAYSCGGSRGIGPEAAPRSLFIRTGRVAAPRTEPK